MITKIFDTLFESWQVRRIVRSAVDPDGRKVGAMLLLPTFLAAVIIIVVPWDHIILDAIYSMSETDWSGDLPWYVQFEWHVLINRSAQYIIAYGLVLTGLISTRMCLSNETQDRIEPKSFLYPEFLLVVAVVSASLLVGALMIFGIFIVMEFVDGGIHISVPIIANIYNMVGILATPFVGAMIIRCCGLLVQSVIDDSKGPQIIKRCDKCKELLPDDFEEGRCCPKCGILIRGQRWVP